MKYVFSRLFLISSFFGLFFWPRLPQPSIAVLCAGRLLIPVAQSSRSKSYPGG